MSHRLDAREGNRTYMQVKLPDDRSGFFWRVVMLCRLDPYDGLLVQVFHFRVGEHGAMDRSRGMRVVSSSGDLYTLYPAWWAGAYTMTGLS